jgi:hypothetical protein
VGACAVVLRIGSGLDHSNGTVHIVPTQRIRRERNLQGNSKIIQLYIQRFNIRRAISLPEHVWQFPFYPPVAARGILLTVAVASDTAERLVSDARDQTEVASESEVW